MYIREINLYLFWTVFFNLKGLIDQSKQAYGSTNLFPCWLDRHNTTFPKMTFVTTLWIVYCHIDFIKVGGSPTGYNLSQSHLDLYHVCICPLYSLEIVYDEMYERNVSTLWSTTESNPSPTFVILHAGSSRRLFLFHRHITVGLWTFRTELLRPLTRRPWPDALLRRLDGVLRRKLAEVNLEVHSDTLEVGVVTRGVVATQAGLLQLTSEALVQRLLETCEQTLTIGYGINPV